nr:hypothetical protein Iba_scaffold47250CG0090 [Ipomoea batatas]
MVLMQQQASLDEKDGDGGGRMAAKGPRPGQDSSSVRDLVLGEDWFGDSRNGSTFRSPNHCPNPSPSV